MAMKDEGATLGEKALQQIAKGLRDIQRLKKDDRSTGLTANARQSNYQVKWDIDIDAATNSVTTPGLGTATIWARVSGGDLYDTGRVLDVVNRSESISYVSGDWGKVERINGEWQPYTGTGGGGETIWFRIVSVECVSSTETILTVEPTWYTGGCTKAIPGADPYTGYVIVEDVCSILRFYTTVFLESGSTIGRATYMYPRAGYCTPTWLVDTICGGPEC
jgi:hypothetical protein